MEVFEYTAEDGENILAEIYYMQSSEDAFGLLSQDWTGEAVDNYYTPFSKRVAPSCRALYGGGLLRMCSGDIYARIMAIRETPDSREAVLKIGKVVTLSRNSTHEPELVKVLPQTMNNDWILKMEDVEVKTVYGELPKDVQSVVSIVNAKLNVAYSFLAEDRPKIELVKKLLLEAKEVNEQLLFDSR